MSENAAALPDGLTVERVDQAAIAADRLLHAYPSRWSLAAIGHVFRRDETAGGAHAPVSLPAAIDRVLRHLDWSEATLRQQSVGMIRERVEAATAKDFADARIVPVRGWLLGETEVRLCHVAALREASPLTS